MFLAPTPGSSNGEESVVGTLGDLSFSHPSGFYDEDQCLLVFIV